MKLKLTPTEIFDAFKALDDKNKMEFMIKLMTDLHNTMGFPMPDGMGNESDDNDEWGYNPLDPDTDMLPTMGLTCIAVHPDRPARKLTVRVELKGIKPPIWRKLVIPSNLMLESFAHVILVAMDWEMEHLHQFVKDDTFYSVPISQDPDMFSMYKNKDSRNYTIGDLIMKEGDKCTFEYDFGDGWEHLITVKEACEYSDDECRTLVELTGGKRACPPEDIGGVPGYMNFCEIIKKPKSKRAKELIEWYGEYDPEDFDPELFAYDIENLEGNGEG